MYRTFAFLEEFRGKIFNGDVPTVLELLLVSEARFGNKSCFTSFTPEKTVLTFSQAKNKIFEFAGALIDKGVKKGDLVALTGKNSIEWAVSYLAIIAAGGVVVPLDYQFCETEIENIIVFTDAKILIVDEEKYDAIGKTHGKEFIKLSLSKEKPNYIFDMKAKPLEKPVLTAPDELAAILFTSGTTGNPKGVMLTHSNLVKDCLLAQMNLNIFHTDVFYAILPLHHSYTMLAVFIEAMSVGAEVVFASKLVVTQMLLELKEGKVTMLLGVPMLFNRVLKGILKGVRAKGIIVYGIIRFLLVISGVIKKVFGKNLGKKLFKSVLEKASLYSVRICISGGGPLSPSTFKIYNQLGIDFVQGYGLTETSPIAALNPVENFKIKSVGKIIPGIEVKIVNPDADGRGEIAIRGPIVMKGYYKNEEATKAVMSEDGFFFTGDVGYLDSENYLYLTGRKKNLIVTGGGKNVFPEEVEDKFQLCENVEQVFIRGYIKDKKSLAEEIEAMFYPSEELRNKCTKEEIYEIMKKDVAEINHKMPPYMWITKIGILDAPLEMTSTKKVKRFKVAREE
ncbi:MAG: AMP-binding protein [Spirochaetaceae bacterium]|nr:AMP-binding protein [Spirochaetaceae bacterium]